MTGPASSTNSIRSLISTKVRRVVQSVVFPDTQVGWGPFAIRKASRAIEEFGIDTVILNAPPYSLLKIGVALKKKFPHIRLITDLRDDWLGYYAAQADGPSDYASSWTDRDWKKARAIERAAVECSTFVSIASPAWVEDLRARYPDQSADKFIYTPNGYEPELFRNFVSSSRSANRIVVTYFGTLNASRVYSPQPYLQALDSLPVEVQRCIETRFVGRVTPECHAYLEGRENVRELGFVSKQEGLEYLADSDYLLLIATNPKSHAGKLFDYLATGKPIIALSPPDGEIAKIIQQTRAGWCIDPWDTHAIRELLLSCHDTSKSGERIINSDPMAVRQYSWPEVARRFADLTGLNRQYLA